MTDKELKLKEIEVSHTLAWVEWGKVVSGRGKWRGCRCYTGVKHCHGNTFKNVYSRRFRQSLGFVTITNDLCACVTEEGA